MLNLTAKAGDRARIVFLGALLARQSARLISYKLPIHINLLQPFARMPNNVILHKNIVFFDSGIQRHLPGAHFPIRQPASSAPVLVQARQGPRTDCLPEADGKIPQQRGRTLPQGRQYQDQGGRKGQLMDIRKVDVH
jgi:hypothetical protein